MALSEVEKEDKKAGKKSADAEENEEAEQEQDVDAKDEEQSIEDRLSGLAGVGEKTAEKMREAGYTELMAIATSSAGDLMADVGVGEDTANKIIASARAQMKMGFESASKVLERRNSIGKITTGSKDLDALLGGGVETQSITESHGAFGCLTGDARITLSDGRMVPIGSFAKGLRSGVYSVNIPVLSMSRNSIIRAVATKLHVYDCRSALRVNLQNGMNLSVTTNHPLMTEFGWKEAGNILQNDRIRIVPDNFFSKEEVRLNTKYSVHNQAPTTIIPKLPKTLTPELGELIAYILGEGWHEYGNQKTGKVSRVCFVSTNSKQLNRFRELVASLFGLEANTRYERINNIKALAIDSVIIGEYLRQFVGLYENAKNKRIPDQIFASPKPVIDRFVASFYDCEGNVKFSPSKRRGKKATWTLKNGSKNSKIYNLPDYGRDINLRSASKELLGGMQIILTKLGIKSWINSDVTRHSGKEFIGYKLHITNREGIQIFYNNIGKHTIRLKDKIERALECYKHRSTSFFKPFVGIESIKWVPIYDGKVYDLEVPQFHNFLADNILSHNSSKTQIGFQLAVNVQLPKEKGGLGGKALVIDTEGSFRPERVQQMAQAAGLDPQKALDNILTARAFNSDHQILLADKAEEVIKSENVKLLVVDSLTSQFRSDYTGRGTLANRQQKMNKHLHKLQKLADTYNLAVYITNQVMARPDIMFGDPTAPIGGHILGHISTFRLYLRKSKGEKRVAKLIDSPNLPEGETVFIVNSDGVRDA